MDSHSWACWQGSLAGCNYTAHKFSQKSCMQGEERQKRGPCCPLHIVRLFNWEIHGLPTLQRTSPASPAPRFQNHHNPQVSTILQAFITAKKCSLGPLCVCLGGRALQKWSGSYSLKTTWRGNSQGSQGKTEFINV